MPTLPRSVTRVDEEITLRWLVVFPFGALVGLAYIVWTFAHFEVLFGG